eukprot:GHVO01013287.1.p1 GENE.GHVO01013287.1~~GHVO01013287.1.p1  ORF type:complete len:183 (-),score=39.18 GHVO01013287.1:113-661(-)
MNQPRQLPQIMPQTPNAGDSIREGTTFKDLHEMYKSQTTSGKVLLPTTSTTSPVFSVEEIVNAAPTAITLRDVDGTLSDGWSARRDANVAAPDALPVTDLMKSWRQRALEAVRSGDLRMQPTKEVQHKISELFGSGYGPSEFVTFMQRVCGLVKYYKATDTSASVATRTARMPPLEAHGDDV